MKNLSRKESQVSRDFDATLKAVVRLSSRTASDVSRSCQNDTNTLHFHETRGLRVKPGKSDSSNYVLGYPSFKSVSDKESRTYDLSKFEKKSSSKNIASSLRSKNSVLNDSQDEICDLKHSKEDIQDDGLVCQMELLEDFPTHRIQHKVEKENNFVHNNISNNSQDTNNKKSFLEKLLILKDDVPFEGTDIDNLSFNLPIIIENEEKLLIKVYGHFTILKLKNKISKRKSLSIREIALIYKNTRLENHITLSWYNINSKSHVFLKILKQVELFGKYLKRDYSIWIYTSEKINEIRDLFAKGINISPEHLELKYKEIFLSNNKEFFLYNIHQGSTIDILKRKMSLTEESPDRIIYEKSPGFEMSQHFQTMTSNLKKCNCENRRLNAMSCGILSTFDKNYKKHNCLKLLSEFSNMHHKSCPKSRTSSISKGKEIEDEGDSITSVGEISLEDGIKSEINRIRENKEMIIEITDLDYLCYTKNFKAFKHFLRDRIGTKCSLKAVAMLYHYAQNLVVHLGPKEENKNTIDKMLRYIKLYFLKYFEKSIISRGGLAELTLSMPNDED